ncbi:MAG: hypothetical protein ACD_45C00220G0002 [uncultured bacterium]|nr:MAG: hypothetical protein ACD_45C00220G0002 [uncultured bacterium]
MPGLSALFTALAAPFVLAVHGGFKFAEWLKTRNDKKADAQQANKDPLQHGYAGMRRELGAQPGVRDLPEIILNEKADREAVEVLHNPPARQGEAAPTRDADSPKHLDFGMARL